VLEVGTGSGYQTALLSLCAEQVFSVERLPALAQAARHALANAGVVAVSTMVGDGTLGWRPYAPYDVIIVAAASPEVPRPLVEQLAPGGRLIVPVGDRSTQTLTLVTKAMSGEVASQTVTGVRFVPLIGQFGFAGEVSS
jgi:protein-L-isoaspartate(D-aspartate) O-methyltransferase